jgi:hypothetical protein
MPALLPRLWHDDTGDQSPLATRRTGTHDPADDKKAANRRSAATIAERMPVLGRT